ncbi:probable LRR receptor-like serine/threonine-protein kinase At4g36180 [Durio zibethinus]|uniref:Probable LRR receptor-like serine/threonine-protein kinase At4g36180 n=1 Tax=Durio zibethinus TaxID=66656 RepID=A0A6P5YUM0_DURZI|nr:probable LRR receptor-like serine/threonine-protein kinase At4g36180 [Durio zibethinus]
MGSVAITLLMLQYLRTSKLGFSARNHNITCIQSERQALLRFKQDPEDPSNRLAARTHDGDCCKWDGIICNNVTGHVIKLQLGSSQGVFASNAEAEAYYLSYLDLSDNDFGETSIPTWFWNLSSNLSYLNISRNQFQGNIPDLLTMIHPPVVIDLCSYNFSGPLPRLSSNVAAVDLSNNSMSGSTSHFLCYKMNEPMKLEVLNLGNNLLSGEIPDCWKMFPRLVAIKLCDNNFGGEIPEEVTSLVGLQSLNFSHNLLVGTIPDNIGAMGSLEYVDLSTNNISGEIPPTISYLTFLSDLNLSYNKITGKITTNTQLQSLSASSFLGTELFGPPLTDSSNAVKFSPSAGKNLDDRHEVDWSFQSVELGFCLGFFGVLVPVLH